MSTSTYRPAGKAELDAARLLLERMGVSLADLTAATAPSSAPAPTFAEYVPIVSAAVGAATRRVYGSYWNKVVQRWGQRRIDEPTTSDVEALVEDIKIHVVARRNARGGRSAAEHLVAALRCLYRHAVADKLIAPGDNPAAAVAKPRRLPSTRQAVRDTGLVDINRVAASTGNDPALDALLLRLHTETACRRGGALALRPIDLDSQQCLVMLREKGGVVRSQPVSPTLMAALLDHARERPAAPVEQLLRYRNGRPITSRRYDYLWKRIGDHLPWVAAQQISTHWLRHTTLTWVERNFGYGVARAYAGHTDSGGDASTTTYIRASVHEVARALAALVGEPHPLVD